MALHLPPHTIQSAAASPVLSVSLNADGTTFASAETGGWRLWDTATRTLLASGALSMVRLRLQRH
jgi:hypothetical protein